MAINVSSKLALALLIIHTTSAILICLTFMPLPAKAILLLLVISNFAYHFIRDVILLLPDSWRKIVVVPDGIFITTQDGSRIYGRVANKTTVSPYFVVLMMKFEGRYFTDSRVIFPDAMSNDEFRELCVFLKFS